MDKHSRVVFSGLSTKVRTRILMDALTSKVADMSLGRNAAEVVEQWRRSHGAMVAEWESSQPQDCPGVRPSQLRRISRHMGLMHFGEICSAARRYLGVDVASLFEELWDALRSAESSSSSAAA
jgi:hypothetical protein